MTKVDIAKIDCDFLGLTGPGSQFVDILGHCFHHPCNIYMDGIWMSTGVKRRQLPLCKSAERRSGAFDASADCAEVRLRSKVIARPHNLDCRLPSADRETSNLRVASHHRADREDRQPPSVLRAAIAA